MRSISPRTSRSVDLRQIGDRFADHAIGHRVEHEVCGVDEALVGESEISQNLRS
jgi:hypothetical protein